MTRELISRCGGSPPRLRGIELPYDRQDGHDNRRDYGRGFEEILHKAAFTITIVTLGAFAVVALAVGQHQESAQRTAEEARHKAIREQLGVFIVQGQELMRRCTQENQPLPAALETPWTRTDVEPCRGRPFGLYGELEPESQNGKSRVTPLGALDL